MLKKILISFVAVFIIIIACPSVFAYESGSIGIDDQASLYTAEQIESLEKQQQDVALKTGWDIAVVTTNIDFDTENSDEAAAYATKYFRERFGSTADGVVYLIDVGHRYIHAEGEAMDYLGISRIKEILVQTEERYFAFDDVGNLETFYLNILYYHELGLASSDSVNYSDDGNIYFDDDSNYSSYSSNESSSFNTNKAALVGIIAGLIAALISVAGVYHSYKTHHVPSANTYMDKASLNFYLRSDRFVREFTTKTRINNDSGSSGGGGGGGGHSSGGAGSGGHR